MFGNRRFISIGLLLLILGIAAGLRFYNRNWDGGIFAHPDERSTVAFYAPTIQWPDNNADLLDPRISTLNPFWNVERQERRSYTYGHFPLYTLVGLAHLLHQWAPVAEGLPLPESWLEFMAMAETGQGYALLGRALMALTDLFSVLLVFLIGRRLYGVWGGLLAAAFSTFTVLQIQLAHFFAVDPISTTFTLLAVFGAMLMYDRQSIWSAVLTGVGVGLAVASKFSALPVIFVPILAGYLASRRATAVGRTSPIIGLVLVALGVSFLVFSVSSPFVLLDFENFRRAVLEEQGNMVSGVADFPFTRQYRNTISYWYFIEQQLRWGMGWPLGLLGLAGTIWVVVKAVRGRAEVGELLSLTWLLLYFVPTGLFLAKFMRYMVPVVPFLSLFGAGLIIALWRWKPALAGTLPARAARVDLLTRIIAGLLAAIVLVSSAVWSVAFVNGVYGTEHTWITFSRWIYDNVPDGACIAYEHWDDRMPVPLPEPGGAYAAHSYSQPILPMYDEDTAQKYELIRNTLSNCDYVVLATNRLWRTIPRLPERYPMSTRYYDALFSGELGYELEHTTETPPRLGPLVFNDQPADESFTVYDHPQPILFKKTRQLTPAEWNNILGNTWQSAVPGYVGPTTLLMTLRGAQANFAVPASEGGSDAGALMLDTPVDQLPPLDDYRWNSLANNSTLMAVVIWWLAVMLIGWVAYPLTALLFHRLPDRGYGLSKSFGLLLLSYIVWMVSSLAGGLWLGNTLLTILLALALLLAVRVLVVMARREDLAGFRQANGWLMVSSELVFGAVFLLFGLLRILNPDLWHPWLGGEKMLEIGFLNAIVKSAAMPPYDPFFSGGIINYYYYGMFIIGVLVKLTGIAPATAFNLAIPTLAGLTAISAFSLTGNIYSGLRRSGDRLTRLVAGCLGVLIVVLMGNLEGAFQFLRNLGQISRTEFTSAIPGLETAVRAGGGLARVMGGEVLAPYNYWDPTRVIPETINEFPFFSFLFADLHPHMIGIPFTLLFLSLAYQLLHPKPVTEQTEGLSPPSPVTVLSTMLPVTLPDIGRWLAIPFVLGSLAAINTWDLPTYLGLVVAAYILARFRSSLAPLQPGRVGMVLLAGLLFAVAVLVGAYLFFWPFFSHYQPPAETGVGLVSTRTPLSLHLKIWGFFLFVLITWLVTSLLARATRHSLLRFMRLLLRRWNVSPHLWQIYRVVVKNKSDLYQLGVWGIVVVFLISVVFFIFGFRVPAYLFPLVVLALLLLFRRKVTPAAAYLNLLTFTGLLVLLGVEFFFLRDFLGGGDYYRMNTLFKFYIQVWVMFGVAVAVILPQLWEQAWRWPLPVQIVWRTATMILLVAGLVYPVFGSRTRVDDRFPGEDNRPPVGTLDGLTYMTTGVFEWPAGNPINLRYDYEAIRWLQDNLTGTPVLAEAKVGYYREGGMRVAAYTGLPSILGGLHQNEQRPPSQVARRDGLVNEFWTTTDPGRAEQLIRQLGISIIYFGQLERAVYGETVADKFEALRQQGLLAVVYENDQTTIYEVMPASRRFSQ